MTQDPGNPADEQLMSAYADGDAGAFDTLFERHRGPLYRFLVHHTGSRQQADDLFQEVFFRVIRAREGYVAKGPFEGWLYTIARNTIADHRRRAEVRSVVRNAGDSVGESDEPESTSWSERLVSSDPSTDPLLMTELSALRDRLRGALSRLPEVQREVFLLRQNTALDFERIAEITGCGVATARSRMRYAIANLRRNLSSDPAGVTS